MAALVTGATPTLAAQDSPSETVRVRLVELDVLATDRNRKPVTDLTPDDLTVEFGQVRQPVALLERLRHLERDPTVRIGISGMDARNAGATVMSGGASRRLMVVIDRTSIERDRAASLRDDIVTFLERVLGPSDQVALFSFDGPTVVEQPFTSDLRQIERGVTRLLGRPPELNSRFVAESKAC